MTYWNHACNYHHCFHPQIPRVRRGVPSPLISLVEHKVGDLFHTCSLFIRSDCLSVVPSRPRGRPQRGFIFLQNFKEWGNQQLTDLGRTRSALPLTGKCAAYQQMAKIFFSFK